MVDVLINPGTGPVDGANRGQATANMQVLVADLGIDGLGVSRYAEIDDGDGRFGFIVTDTARPNGNEADVLMPGLPLDQVRFLDEPDQNIFDFPRLYVMGSSWLWMYAVRILRSQLREEAQ